MIFLYSAVLTSAKAPLAANLNCLYPVLFPRITSITVSVFSGRAGFVCFRFGRKEHTTCMRRTVDGLNLKRPPGKMSREPRISQQVPTGTPSISNPGGSLLLMITSGKPTYGRLNGPGMAGQSHSSCPHRPTPKNFRNHIPR